MISYVLVRREGGPALYWGHGQGPGCWTEDPAQARRYARSASAQAARSRLLSRPEVDPDSFHVEMMEEAEK